MDARGEGEDAGAELGPEAAFGSALPPPSRPANVEALVALAETALDSPERERAGGERCQLVVHVAAAVLSGARAGRCELVEGPALARETAHRPGCDSSLVALLERAGEPLFVGCRTRTIGPALRRALRVRDRGCRFPGCDNRRFVDAHHVEHWARGGETSLDNLILLCRRHHRLVHEGGYGLERDRDGEPRFRDPGSRFPRCRALLPPTPPTCSSATAASDWQSIPRPARAASASGWISALTVDSLLDVVG